MDLQEDIRQFVMTNLPHDAQDTAALQAKSANELLIIYCNWHRRLIPPRKRTVHQSTALKQNPLATDPRCKPALDHIIGLLEAGGDVTPRLSKLTDYGYETTKPRRDLDVLLNDWNIYHLHLSRDMEPAGKFVERADYLLFAAFREDDAYLINIMNHSDPDIWVDEELIEIVVRENWLDIGVVREMPGILPADPLGDDGVRRPLTRDDRKAVRKNGLFMGVVVDGTFYVPTSGLTTARTSLSCTEFADTVSKRIANVEMDLADTPDHFVQLLQQYGITPPPELDLHFEFFQEGGYGVVERHTGARFALHQS